MYFTQLHTCHAMHAFKTDIHNTSNIIISLKTFRKNTSYKDEGLKKYYGMACPKGFRLHEQRKKLLLLLSLLLPNGIMYKY